MPITPKYYRQQKLPGALGAPRAQPPVSGLQSFERLGYIATDAALYLKKRYDESKITAGYNEFSDVARKKLSELLALRGENATGLGEKYDDWYGDFSSDYLNKRLGNTEQRSEWEKLTLTQRSQHLNILALHEAQELERFRTQAEDGLVTATIDGIISNPFDDAGRKVSVDIFFDRLNNLRPGEDITALKDKYEKQIYGATLQAMINDNPIKAASYLEIWKDIIGPDQYRIFKRQLDTGVSNQKADAAYGKMQAMFGESTAGILKAINYLDSAKNYRKEGLTLDEAKSVKDKLWTVYQRRKAVEDEQKKRLGDEELKAFTDALYVDNDPAAAFNILRDAVYLSPETRQRLIDDAKNAPFESDPQQIYDLKRLVYLDPFSIDAQDIWGWERVSDTDKAHLQERWERALRMAEEDPDKYSLRGRMTSIVDEMRRQFVFSESIRQNALIWSKVIEDVDNYLEKNPDVKHEQAINWLTEHLSDYRDGIVKRIIRGLTEGLGFEMEYVEGDLTRAEDLEIDRAKRYFRERGPMPKDPLAEYERLYDEVRKRLVEENKAHDPQTVRMVMDRLD